MEERTNAEKIAFELSRFHINWKRVVALGGDLGAIELAASQRGDLVLAGRARRALARSQRPRRRRR